MARLYHELPEARIKIIAEGDSLDLGGKTLRFIEAPWLHWPETMFTYEATTQTLFPCDAFGGYGIPDKGIYDGDYDDLGYFEAESLRYYTNIVAAFSKPVLNAGDKLADLPLRIVAPSHGLVWNKNPQRIVDLYLKWSGYGKGSAEKGVTLLHGSMYGNTDKMLAEVKRGLEASGVPVTAHDVATTPVSYILPALWINQAVMIGAPTYEGTLFPTMQMVLHMAEIKRVFNKQAAYFGSYGWGGGATRFLKAQCEKMNWELGEVLDFAGQPSAEDLKAGFAFGKRFGESIR